MNIQNTFTRFARLISNNSSTNPVNLVTSLNRVNFLFFLCLVFLLCFACGKKGDPTLKSYEKPEPPARLRAVYRPSEVILTWDFPKNKEAAIKGFYLMRSSLKASSSAPAGWGDFEKVALIENSGRLYTDADIQHTDACKYKIISRNLRDITGKDSNIIEVITKKVSVQPSGLSFKITDNTLMIDWQVAEETASYNIYKSDSKGVYPLTPLNKQPVKVNSYKDSFDPNKTVYYTVRTCSGDEVRYESAASEELEINPSELIPSSPSNLQAVVSKESVVLVWNEPDETWVKGYKIYRETDKKKGFVFIGEISVPSFTDTDKPLTKRNYRVTAIGPVKEGPAAEIKNIIYIKPK
jgi:hypothetical protein